MVKSLKEERLGSVRLNKHGSEMKVIEYNGAKDITVQFSKGDTVHTSWQMFNKGVVRSVYDKTVYGVGYIGGEAYANEDAYNAWHRMMERCYNPKYKEKKPTYEGCVVNPVWHNFQNFRMWYELNYYSIEGETMCLDKDILLKRNKVYSPTTCVYVPETINTLFTKGNANRGYLPIGVTEDKRTGKYMAQMHKKTIGYFGIPQEAFLAYKEAKEQHIKEVAEKYKHHIPIKLYEALLRYEVEIDD
ncbi:hypothetical protein BCP8-2_140 [Bacillus phage BCP8-2]|uniref:Uncharacterized protein n=1 Tax=Bacillus phage BCP8-2 TaxID=1129192 RepID=A0A0E3D9T4_9CAUD|nr:HNH endonuclease [Bacillus phage BCP8-2]AHJ87178.1 hypothetical protein BCP8-2_140 [Bacillus phage BCP8-2]